AAGPARRADWNGVRPGDRRRALRADPRRDRLDRRHGPHVHRGRRDRAAAGPVGVADAGSDARAAAARLPSVPGSASRERISVRRMMVAYGIGVYPTTIHIVT